ncbi:RAD55 family ATPase [Methanoregula sp.]|uniref:RAD55 family ATPase n=1 Tax=Methanoregula sp. TaxID=2052170 RepID=UPI003562386B
MYNYKTGIEQIDSVCGGFEAGTNILILAPPMSYADQLAYALIKPLQGEYSIVLSTNERAAEVVDYFKVAGADKRFVGVIDAITKSSTPSIADTTRLMFVSSPTDLTGIGIKFSNMIETIFEGDFSDGEPGLFPPPVRFCVNSISTLLMYRRLEVLYQFLHVLTAKLKKIEGVGIYLLNSESFDEKTLSLIKQLMNCVIEVKMENNITYLRIMGIRGVTGEWLKFTVTKGQVVILP